MRLLWADERKERIPDGLVFAVFLLRRMTGKQKRILRGFLSLFLSQGGVEREKQNFGRLLSATLSLLGAGKRKKQIPGELVFAGFLLRVSRLQHHGGVLATFL